MPYDEKLADRVGKILLKEKNVTERKMFGGLCYMINGHMCCGVEKNRLVIRVGKENYEKYLNLKGASPMDFTGKPLRGFLYISNSAVKTSAQLQTWIKKSLNFVKTLPEKSNQ